MNQIPNESSLEKNIEEKYVEKRSDGSEIKTSYASTTALATNPMVETSKTATRQSGSLRRGGFQRGRPIIRLSLVGSSVSSLSSYKFPYASPRRRSP